MLLTPAPASTTVGEYGCTLVSLYQTVNAYGLPVGFLLSDTESRQPERGRGKVGRNPDLLLLASVTVKEPVKEPVKEVA